MRIKSRVESFEELGDGRGVRATLSDGTHAYADVLVGADGIWSQVRKLGLRIGLGLALPHPHPHPHPQPHPNQTLTLTPTLTLTKP